VGRNLKIEQVIFVPMTADTEEKLIELKATALIYKPYEIDDIIETIHKVKDGIIVAYATS